MARAAGTDVKTGVRQRGYRAMGYRVGVDASYAQASMEDVEVPGLVPSEQFFAGQEAAGP